MSDCGSKTGTTNYLFLCCLFFYKRKTKITQQFVWDRSLRNLDNELPLDILFYGSDKYKGQVNKKIPLHTINFINTAKPSTLKDHWLTNDSFFIVIFFLFTFVRTCMHIHRKFNVEIMLTLYHAPYSLEMFTICSL